MLITAQLLEGSPAALSISKSLPKTKVFLRMERQTTTHINQGWRTLFIASQNMLCRLSYLEVFSKQVTEREANAASEDRPPPTASGDREQDVPDWLQPFAQGLVEGKSGLVEGKSGSSGSAGETITKTPPPHLPARFEQKTVSNSTDQKSSKVLYWICLERRGDHTRQLEPETSQTTQQPSFPHGVCNVHRISQH